MPENEKIGGSGGSWSLGKILGIVAGVVTGIAAVAVTAWAIVTFLVKTDDGLYDVQLGSDGLLRVRDREAQTWGFVCSSNSNPIVMSLTCAQIGFVSGTNWADATAPVSEADATVRYYCVDDTQLPTAKTIQDALYTCRCESQKVVTLECQDCGRRKLSADRIVGGAPAQEGMWPWQVSLRFEGDHICGGSVIAPKWIVTAAHCFHERYRYLNGWTVSVGDVKRTTSGVARPLEAIVYHSGYSPFVDAYAEDNSNDIAVVRVRTPLEFTDTVQPICLPALGQRIVDGKICSVTGWGHTHQDGQLSEVLQEAQVPVISNAVCNSEAYYNREITAAMFCAGYSEGKVDACQGDSGGPLVCEDSLSGTPRWRLCGIVSWGTGCALAKKPGVYCRVTEYQLWVYRTMKNFASVGGIHSSS